jgi:hypothetical protein
MSWFGFFCFLGCAAIIYVSYKWPTWFQTLTTDVSTVIADGEAVVKGVESGANTTISVGSTIVKDIEGVVMAPVNVVETVVKDIENLFSHTTANTPTANAILTAASASIANTVAAATAALNAATAPLAAAHHAIHRAPANTTSTATK